MTDHHETGGMVDILPGRLPISTLPKDIDPEGVIAPFIEALGSLTISHFTEGALWRDLFGLTGLPRTFYSAKSIVTAWNEVSAIQKPFSFEIIPGTATVTRMNPSSSWVEARFTFRTKGVPAARCSGMISLVPDGSGGWKIWLLRTLLEQIEQQPNVDAPKPRPLLANYELDQGNEIPSLPHFDCVVVGAGHAGLSTAGRLQSLDVSYLLIEKNTEIGANWMLRYDSLKLHTVRASSHLPFEQTFPAESYSEFLSKYDLAKAYKTWAEKLGINIWLSTSLTAGSWDENLNTWTLTVQRQNKVQLLTARHLVLATGPMGQVPISPSFPGREKFRGSVLHSVDYKCASQWKGKSAAIIGSANTAHDIAEDMIDAGMSVTMVQRGRTCVLPFEWYQAGASRRYNDDIPTDLSDRLDYTTPFSISSKAAAMHLHAMARANSERFEALERVGFKVNAFGNPIYTIYERGGGHYIDVGASTKIAQGLIKVKSDALIAGYTEEGLIFDDGSELKADIILHATGFETSYRPTIARILGPKTAAQVDDFWGLDHEGEIKGAYKPSGHPGFWLMGGAIVHARFFSRFVAMQIKTALSGTPLIVYSRTPAQGGEVADPGNPKEKDLTPHL
ncbi:hypothetical protein FQN50_006104 [Emmonsiellopsis sp. PD_5]|nr:hypothetical protein FQN50_006104 [Emmonsiellopsis sp. PD_5]